MTCPSCQAAEANPLTPAFHSGCPECSARALAHSPMYHAACMADAITVSYRMALQGAFGEGWKAGHERVKKWAERIESARKVGML